MSPMLRAALAFAARGWPVFPCDPEPDKAKGSKRPLTRRGLKDATTDTAAIESWWSRWPDALIGLPTGPTLGAFVVDLDPREKDCAALWSELEERIGVPLGDPIVAETQSGGWHLYYAWPADADGGPLRNRAGLVPHVDVRGEGGYVIAPPSIMGDGKAYRWRSDKGVLPAAPAELVDCIMRRGAFGQRKAPRAASPPPSADDAVRKYGLTALDAELRELSGAPDGTRNEALYTTALRLGSLIGAGALSRSTAEAGLEGIAGGWPNMKKSRTTIRNGIENGMASPRDLSGLSRPSPQSRSSGPSTPPSAKRGSQASPSGASQPRQPAGRPPDDEIAAANALLEQNDTGNGERLLNWFRHDVLYVREVGWAMWDGRRWKIDGGEDAVSRMAQETARRIMLELPFISQPTADEDAILGEARQVQERLAAAKFGGVEVRASAADADKIRAASEVEARLKDRRGKRARYAVSSGNTGKLAAMKEVAATHQHVDVAGLDAEPLAINVHNGTLRIEWLPDPDTSDDGSRRMRPTMRLDAHNPDDRISLVMPVEYDPEVTCPRWMAFVERFLPDPDVRGWVQRWQGYSMTGLTDAQLLVFHHGLGANGKSTFCEAIRRIVGDYAASLPSEAVTGEQSRRSDQATPEFARLAGKRVILVSELPRTQPLKEETIKLLTGGEPLLVRHLNKGFFDLFLAAKATIVGNHKPSATGSDYAVWRRLRLVPWVVKLSEEERRPMAEILAEFDEERSGILNWLLQGLMAFLVDGLKAPRGIIDATEEYRSEVDPVGQFVADCVREKVGHNIDARSMYETYILWCKANSVREFSETRFAKEMAQTGIQKIKERVRKYSNVILVNVPSAMQVDEETPMGY